MSLTTRKKVAIATLLSGGIGYIGKHYLIGYAIADLIKEYNPKRKLISTTTSLYSEKWRNAWKRYLEDNKNRERDIWEIDVWNSKLILSKKIESVPTSFIDACERFSANNVLSTSNSLYQEVLKWCTSDSSEKISDLIKDKGKRMLNNKDIEKGINSEWRAALQKYLKINSNPLGIEGIEGIEEALKQKDLGVARLAMDSFSKKCEELGEKREKVTDWDISKVIEHCSAKRTVKDLIIDERPDRGFIDVSQIHNNSPTALELWNNYLNSNKDKEQDDWNLGNWSGKKNDKHAPDGFFNNCKDKASKVALNIELKMINELIRYCTYDSKVEPIYLASQALRSK